MKTITILLILLCNVSYTLADTTETLKEYDIEIIIFEDAHARYLNSESWHSSGEEPLLNSNPRKQNKSKPKLLAKGDYTTINSTLLKTEYRRINNSSEFNILQYSAWRQAGLNKADAFEIDIRKLKNRHERKSENTISGNLKVVLARYLHFYSQLEYERQNDTIDELADGESITIAVAQSADINKKITQKPVNKIHKLQSHRRMRSKELHYIDHPLVGILIQINPVELATPDQAN